MFVDMLENLADFDRLPFNFSHFLDTGFRSSGSLSKKNIMIRNYLVARFLRLNHFREKWLKILEKP